MEKKAVTGTSGESGTGTGTSGNGGQAAKFDKMKKYRPPGGKKNKRDETVHLSLQFNSKILLHSGQLLIYVNIFSMNFLTVDCQVCSM
jgi:hypothetical protein